ncbi:MAG: hypothetical protein M5U28_14075 [Sandaracinaceae bacterium]|nr:hypothetical protein [Sandaracinaceae bacterium]
MKSLQPTMIASVLVALGTRRRLSLPSGALHQGHSARGEGAHCVLGGAVLVVEHLLLELAERVGRRALPDPEAHGEALLAERLDALATDHLQRADERGRAAELVEGQQAQCVTEEHGDAEALVRRFWPRSRRSSSVNAITPRYASVLPPPVGEEDQLDVLAIGVLRVRDPVDVQQDERELEQAPLWPSRLAVALRATAQGRVGHGAVGEPEGLEHLRVGRQSLDATADPRPRHLGLLDQLGLGGAPRVAVDVDLGLVDQPRTVGVDDGHQALARFVAGLDLRQHLHVDGAALRRIAGAHAAHLVMGQPRGADARHAVLARRHLHRHAVADGVLMALAELEIGDLIIPLVAALAAPVGAGVEPRLVRDLHLHLEQELRVLLRRLLVRRAVVHEEERERPDSRRHPGRLGGFELTDYANPGRVRDGDTVG